MTKPTNAQLAYLDLLRESGQARIHDCGRRSTGRACQRRGWIWRVRVTWYGEALYEITSAGRAVLEENKNG